MMRPSLALLSVAMAAQAATAGTLINQTMDHIDPSIWQRVAGNGKAEIGNSLASNMLPSGDAIIYNPAWNLIPDPVRYSPGHWLKLYNARMTPEMSAGISSFYKGRAGFSII